MHVTEATTEAIFQKTIFSAAAAAARGCGLGMGGLSVFFFSYGTPLFSLRSISQSHLMRFPQRPGDLQPLLTTPVEMIGFCEKYFFCGKTLSVLLLLLLLFLGIPDTKKMLLQKHPVATRSFKKIANLA